MHAWEKNEANNTRRRLSSENKLRRNYNSAIFKNSGMFIIAQHLSDIETYRDGFEIDVRLIGGTVQLI